MSAESKWKYHGVHVVKGTQLRSSAALRSTRKDFSRFGNGSRRWESDARGSGSRF